MKNKFKLTVIAALGLCAFALNSPAASPSYVTQSAGGNAAAGASLIIPADPSSQIRIVNLNNSTDTNNSVLSFASGTTAYTLTRTNWASTSVTNQINSTNGLYTGATLVLQHRGVCYVNTLLTWNQTNGMADFNHGTNVVLNSGGWGVAASPGDSIYLMSAATTLPAPAAASGTTTTAAINGEVVYVGTYVGRPVSVSLTPAFVTNRLNTVTAHYD